jgi:hypothetical protein
MMNSLDRPSARVIGGGEDDDTIELELNESAIRALTEAALLARAAFEERPEPGLTPEANELGAGGFEPETRADERGPRTLEREATDARQASEAFEREAPTGRQGTVSFVRPPRKSRRFALGLGTAAAVAGLLGGLAYLATARARHPIPIVADSGSRPTTAPEAPTSAPAPSAAPDVPVRFKNPFDASEVFEFPAGTSQIEVRDAVAEVLSQRARERQNLFVKRPRRNTNRADRNASVTASRATPRS